MPSDQTHYKIRNTKSTEKLDEGSTRKKLQVSQSFRNKQREKLHTKNHMKKCDKMWTTSTTQAVEKLQMKLFLVTSITLFVCNVPFYM